MLYCLQLICKKTVTVGARFSVSKYEALYFRARLFPVLLAASCLDQMSCVIDLSLLCFFSHSSEITAVLTPVKKWVL